MKLLLYLIPLAAGFSIGVIFQGTSVPAATQERLLINDPAYNETQDITYGFLQQLMIRFKIKSITLKTKLHPDDWNAGSLIFTSEDPDRKLFEGENTTIYLETNK